MPEEVLMPEWMKPGAVARLHGTIYANGAKRKNWARITITKVEETQVTFTYYHMEKRARYYQRAPVDYLARLAAMGDLKLIKKGGNNGED